MESKYYDMFKPLKITQGKRDIYQNFSLRGYLANIFSRQGQSDLRDIPDFPLAIHIELTSFCDNNCTFCTRKERKRESQHMSEGLYHKIIDECARHKSVNSIALFKDGDPILYPTLCESITYAKERNAAKSISISTSGNSLNPDLSRKIIQSGLDEIFFSLDALTFDKYSKIKGTDNYAVVIKNILDFVRIRDSLNQTTPKVIIKMLALDSVQEDIDLFVRLWVNIADQVLIDREINIWDGTNKRVNDLLLDMKNYPRKDTSRKYPCNRPWYMMAIYADGKVTVCPEDWDQKMIIGDINHDTISDIWNGDALYNIKKCHVEGNLEKLPTCNTCDALYMKNIGTWFSDNKEKALKRRK